MTAESKERVTLLTSRIVLLLQQRAFTADETQALIKCLQALLDHQLAKTKDDTMKNTVDAALTAHGRRASDAE